MAEKHVYQYPNGATLIYYQTNAAEKTDATLGFRCGTQCEGELVGITHLLEHMLFTGTKHLDKKQLAKVMRLAGAENNGGTEKNSVNISFTCPASNTELLFRLGSEMLFKKDFTDEELDREREVVRQELYRNDTSKKSKSSVNGEIILKHGVLGSDDTLDRIKAKDLTNYSDDYFISENMVLSVVSSLPYKEIKSYIDKYYMSKVKSNPENKVTTPKQKGTFLVSDRTVTIPKDEKNTITAQFIFKGDQDNEKFDLYTHFEDFYFNGDAGLFYEKMRLDKPLVYQSGFSIDRAANTNLKFLYAQTTPDKLDEVIDETMKILNHVIYEGITDKDMLEFKQYLMAKHEMRDKTKDRDSSELFYCYIYGYEFFTPNFYQKLLSLSKDDINNHFKETYGMSKMILSLSGNLDSYCNLPTEKELAQIEYEYRNAPWTIPDEVNERLYIEKLQKLQERVKDLPTHEDILPRFRIDSKIFYDMRKRTLLANQLSPELKQVLIEKKTPKIRKVHIAKKLLKYSKEYALTKVEENENNK